MLYIHIGLLSRIAGTSLRKLDGQMRTIALCMDYTPKTVLPEKSSWRIFELPAPQYESGFRPMQFIAGVVRLTIAAGPKTGEDFIEECHTLSDPDLRLSHFFDTDPIVCLENCQATLVDKWLEKCSQVLREEGRQLAVQMLVDFFHPRDIFANYAKRTLLWLTHALLQRRRCGCSTASKQRVCCQIAMSADPLVTFQT